MLTLSLVLALMVALGATVGMAPARSSDDPPATVTVTTTVRTVSSYRGLTASQWAARFRHRTRQLQAARAQVRHVERIWRPTVTYALTLASAVFGVPYSELATVSRCESTWNPFAVEPGGTYKGLFQLGWRPFGLDPFDPIANALSAAQTVRHDGSWRQWQCKP